ncbi:formylmethanofuran dehydrogenase [candidate division MSBL1 archaeon SCGC-AAA259E17]|uniref:Formylmethanofuran dehydrogenase n=1 Tax=candidate division MSBL1 archaeon SCGC-AAA259E17 TaxID=1698263 RepID=A0A133UGP0_9EURY|nr:formylmethanofuran dehydrogenase [candidate division MSBL1 archaeon SCGC-AAA259E17]
MIMSVRNDVVCTWCGCCCDDIEVRVEDGNIQSIENGCRLSKSKFLNHDRDRVDSPKIKRSGELVNVSMEEALEEVADILKDSEFPLIYGLSSTDVEAQRLSTELAEITGASIDNTSSVCHSPTIFAIQSIGAQECTLGEVKNRADLVFFWGSNPMSAHPRHPTRYSVMPAGLHTEGGREDRKIISVDVRETTTAKMADRFIQIEPGKDYELFSAIRATLKGYDLKEGVGGISPETIEELAQEMKEAKFGAIYFGLGLTMSTGKHMNVTAAIQLVKDLNDHTKFVINPMRGHFNVAGANKVLTWLTGYPLGVNFSRGYPIYGPGEFTAVDVLSRKECDAAVVIASDPASHLPSAASEHLADIPTVVLDPKFNATTYLADVVVPTAMAGIESEGTTYRMDGVPLRLKKVVDSDQMSDSEVLEKIIEKVR